MHIDSLRTEGEMKIRKSSRSRQIFHALNTVPA